MEIRERIAKIIALEGVTAAAFADMVGIQRSNVSHILNGRSGPSLELLQKILSTFPHYNTDWLVMGRGEIRRQPVQKTIFDEIGEPDPYADNVPDVRIMVGILRQTIWPLFLSPKLNRQNLKMMHRHHLRLSANLLTRPQRRLPPL